MKSIEVIKAVAVIRQRRITKVRIRYLLIQPKE